MSDERPSPEMDFDEKFEEKPQHGPSPRVRRRASLFWPLLLIGAGTVLLLQELDFIQIESWASLWRYWPILLILGGLDILLGRRSFLGGLLGALISLALVVGVIALIFSFDDNENRLIDLNQVALERASVEHPLGDNQEADVTLNLNRWPTSVSALDDSSNLIEGEIEYVGELEFDTNENNGRAEVDLRVRDRDGDGLNWFLAEDGRWEIKLSPKVELTLDLDAGSGSGEYDLSELQISELDIDGGAGSFDLMLPDERNMIVYIDAGSGSIDLVLPERGTAEMEVDGSSGSFRMTLPDSMAVRLELDDGTGSLNAGDRFVLVEGERNGDGVWETEDWDRSENRILIRFNQRSGSITFDY